MNSLYFHMFCGKGSSVCTYTLWLLVFDIQYSWVGVLSYSGSTDIQARKNLDRIGLNSLWPFTLLFIVVMNVIIIFIHSCSQEHVILEDHKWAKII